MNPQIASSAERNWRKALRSLTNGECVEVADAGRLVAVRDSKRPEGVMISYSSRAWRSFVAETKEGR